jgi:hypothetical protein
LQLAFTDPFGGSHPSAYHRITEVMTDILARKAKVRVSTYIGLAARQGDKVPVSGRSYHFSGTEYDLLFGVGNTNPANKNPLKNIYDHIKTRPEWAGATDV